MASEFNRGIMKFEGADSPLAIAVSAALIFWAICFLIRWALHSVYALG